VLVVQHGHDEIRGLQEKRGRIGGSVPRRNRDDDRGDAMRARRVGHRLRDGQQLVQIAGRHSLEVDHDSVISARVDERRDCSRGQRRHLRVFAEPADYFGMEATADVGGDERHRARSDDRVLPDAVGIQPDGAKAGCVERDPAGDDSLEARAMRLDGRVAIRVPGSGKTPVRRRHAWLRGKMRAGGEEREPNLAKRATIQAHDKRVRA